MGKPSPARYRTTNWSSFTAYLRKRGSLLIWLDKKKTWLAPYGGSPGRPAVFSDAAIQFCLTIKVLFKMPLRQTTGMIASLLKMADLDWAVSDYTTLYRRQKTLAVQMLYRQADGLLNLLVDSNGIKVLGDGEWQARKQSVQGRRQWREVHLPWTSTRLTFGRWSVPQEATATVQSCQSCWTKLPRARTPARLPQTEPTTRAASTPPSSTARRRRS